MVKDPRRTAVPPVGATSDRGDARGAGQVDTSSALPLFPSDPGERGSAPAQPRAPLGVRRPTPAVSRLRLEAPDREPNPKLSFERARPGVRRTTVTRRAAPAVRLAAGLFDVVLLAVVDAVVVVLTLRLAGFDLQSLSALPIGPLVVFLTVLNGGYVVGLTCAGGQTFGKMAFGVRVVDRAGRSVTGAISLVRALGYLVSVLPLGLGIALMFFDTRRLALHDRLAGTRVLMVSGRARHRSLFGARNRDAEVEKAGVGDRHRPPPAQSPDARIHARDTR